MPWVLSRADLFVSLCAVLHFMPKHCCLGFLAVAYFYLSACASRLPFVRVVLKNSFGPVCPHFVCVTSKNDLHVTFCSGLLCFILSYSEGFSGFVINFSSNLVVQPTFQLQTN